MLDSVMIDRIERFVYARPRSVQEIAQHIGKNWRTADRYIDELSREFGTISARTFREGTRGALKIVYWSSAERISGSVFQERLEQDISQARHKEDFSAFDIYQYVHDKNKRALVMRGQDQNSADIDGFIDALSSAKRQVLLFSGNISFINLRSKKRMVLDVLDDLVSRKVAIKVLCRIDLEGRDNIERLIGLNFKHKFESIEIRHHEHPLRGFIVDNTLIRLKEIKEPTGKIYELDKKTFIFYTIQDKEWSAWLSRVFWKMFSNSVGASKRLEEIHKLK